MAGSFHTIEEQYFKLRGQFAAGRITSDEFDEALRDLTVTDHRGRVWMMGANSARWYYYDGKDWVAGDPAILEEVDSVLDAGLPDQEPVTPAPESGLPALSIPGAPRDLTIRPVIAALALLAFALIAFAFLLNRAELGSVSEPSTPTRRIPVTPSPASSPPGILSPTPVAVLLPAVSSTPPTAAPTSLAGLPDGPQPTSAPPTITLTPSRTPRGQRTTPTQTLSPFSGIPTATPLGAPTATVPSDLTPGADGPLATEPPESTPGPAPNQPPPNPGLPPDVYVTGLTINPQPGERNEPVVYTASFLNTTGVPRSFAWRIVILDPNKQGRNQDWGQSIVESISIPPGRSSFSISHITVTGGGGCIPLLAIPAWEGEGGARIFFQNTTHGVLTVGFDVC